MSHCIRRCHGLEFVKCQLKSCAHCSRQPPKAAAFISNLYRQGGHSFFPTPDPSFPDHYMTCIGIKGNPADPGNVDKNCPSIRSHWEACTFGCSYVFLSTADKEKHIKVCRYLQNKAEKRQLQQQTEEKRSRNYLKLFFMTTAGKYDLRNRLTWSLCHWHLVKDTNGHIFIRCIV